MGEDEEEDGEPLVEPSTSWQHLMDENTKHYYYWNTQSNAVTWTIPAVRVYRASMLFYQKRFVL